VRWRSSKLPHTQPLLLFLPISFFALSPFSSLSLVFHFFLFSPIKSHPIISTVVVGGAAARGGEAVRRIEAGSAWTMRVSICTSAKPRASELGAVMITVSSPLAFAGWILSFTLVSDSISF